MSTSSSGIGRFFTEVQRLITEWWKAGQRITTKALQFAVFESNYDPDSSYQVRTIRGCVERGRQQAITLWGEYLASDDFLRDGEELRHYRPDEIEKAMDSDDFVDFAYELNRGRFGNGTTDIRKHLEEYGIIARLFTIKLKEFSKAGNNLVVATGGAESEWFIPTFWRWCIRDYKLYLRTIQTLHMQLERGRTTKLLLPSGEPLEKALALTGVTRAALEDGTAWECPRCQLRNPGTHDRCANCNTPKPTVT